MGKGPKSMPTDIRDQSSQPFIQPTQHQPIQYQEPQFIQQPAQQHPMQYQELQQPVQQQPMQHQPQYNLQSAQQQPMQYAYQEPQVNQQPVQQHMQYQEQTSSSKQKTMPTDILPPALSPVSPVPFSSSFSNVSHSSDSSKARIHKHKITDRPTDTFKIPFPDGYYRTEFPVQLPSHFTQLLPTPQKLRYTAASCGFDAFADPSPIKGNPYTLRQQEVGQSVKMMIVITMYNEDAGLFSLTMDAVYKNIEYLLEKEKKSSETKKEDAKFLESGGNNDGGLTWKDIVVCIVCDGRHKCPTEVKIAMNMLGCYQADELIMTDFQEEPVQAHIFEYTSSVHLLHKPKSRTAELKPSKYPTNYLICMKENNKKKIDSHGWALAAFAPLIKPEVVVLLDMGTNPFPNAFYQFYKHFDGNPRVGGVCGEIIVEVKGSWFGRRLWNLWTRPLLAAQNFEYKMSNILDKPLHSLFGYITVLPGAFSAYRYTALLGKPLTEYFAAEAPDDSKEKPSGVSCVGCFDLSTANKYLAEDRILCFEIFTKKNANWLLRYIPEARATTDAPDTLGQFLNQRRRWLNGSLFAFLSAFVNMGDVFSSSHSIGRKFSFILENIYLFLETFFSLIAPMNFYAVFILSLINISGSLNINVAAVYALGFLYILIFIFGFIIFVGNNPRGSHFLYKFLSRVWMVFMFLILLALGYSSYLLFLNSPSPVKIVLFLVAMLATFGLYFFSSLISGDISHIISSMFGYTLLVPTYINMMLPFALSNINDISWGTRPKEPEAGTGRKLPKNQVVDGHANMNDVVNPNATALLVDVSDFEARLKAAAENDPNSQLARKKNKEVLSTEDQNKNMRFFLLFAFFLVNLLGSAAITYGAAISQNVGEGPNDSRQGFNLFVENYMIALFISIAFFALVRFIGVVGFKLSTPKY